MQYPQIQFYKGSLVRLASGKLKQVEDLSSDDFIESARLACSTIDSQNNMQTSNNPINYSNSDYNNNNNNINSNGTISNGHQRIDENNNSVFNSPEPQTNRSSFDCSPTMEVDDDSSSSFARQRQQQQHQQHQLLNRVNLKSYDVDDGDDDDDDDDIELDVVTDGDPIETTSKLLPVVAAHHNQMLNNSHQTSPLQMRVPTNNGLQQSIDNELYIDSSVVRDFLEVGPPSSTSPASSTGSLNRDFSSQASTSSSSPIMMNSNSMGSSSSSSQQFTQNPTVLIKFFLESSRTIAFIEVPIEHPFFVFYRGWSSWNPQRTYDKFGLKCRKLKIGDTCISLIRRQCKQQKPHHQLSSSTSQHQQLQGHNPQQQDSDQCNILFSSIKIHE